MPWSVFWETLRRELRSTLFWGAGMGILGLFTTAIMPDPAALQQLVETLEALPPFLFQMLGVPDLSVLATPVGFIALRYFVTATLLFAVWGVISGLNVTANDEARGIANMVISLPVPRWRLIVEKLLAYVPFAFVIPLAGVGGLALGMGANPIAQTDIQPLITASLMMVPVALIVLCLTAMIGAAVPRRALAGYIAGGFIATSFLLKSVANVARSDFSDALAQFSIFQHADALVIIRDGVQPLAVLAMVGAAAVLTWLAIGLFRRRDVAA